MLEILKKLPHYINTLMYSGFVIFTDDTELLTETKKQEYVKDLDIVISKLNEIKVAVNSIQIK